MLIALFFALMLAWSLPADAPSRNELAEALTHAGHARITPADIRSVDCDRRVATGQSCRWQQRVDGAWEAHAGRIAIRGSGWRMVPATDAP